MVQDLKLKLTITQRELASIFQLVDVDGDGKVSRRELVGAFLNIKSWTAWFKWSYFCLNRFSLLFESWTDSSSYLFQQ